METKKQVELRSSSPNEQEMTKMMTGQAAQTLQTEDNLLPRTMKRDDHLLLDHLFKGPNRFDSFKQFKQYKIKIIIER